MTEAKGIDGTISIEGDEVVLTFSGFTTQAVKKAVSPRRIPLSSIADIEVTAPKGMKAGALRLVLAGDAGEAPKRESDINAVQSNKGKTEKALAEMAERLRPLIAGAAAVPFDDQDVSVTDAPASAASLAVRADIAAAKARMRVSLGGGREIKRLPEHLWEGEIVQSMTTGTYGKGTGLVVMTDRRLLFVQDGIMSKTTEDFPYSKISSVSWNSGMMVGTVVVFASGNKAEITNVNKDDGKAMVGALRARLADSPPVVAGPVATAPGQPDVMEQLKKLGDLRDAGILSEEEFSAKKAELLARL